MTDDTVQRAAKIIAEVICNVPMNDLSSRGGSLKAAQALEKAGMLQFPRSDNLMLHNSDSLEGESMDFH